jgi:acyl-CoA ligase (AMP-forming) (exosortase A-associated)
MFSLLPELVLRTADARPGNTALRFRGQSLAYGDLATGVRQFASGLLQLGLARSERVAIYLPKQFETVVAFFGTSLAGGVFVPVNPLLKADQVAHILRDCNVRVLVTSPERAGDLDGVLATCPDLRSLVLVGSNPVTGERAAKARVTSWRDLLASGEGARPHRIIDADMAAILYTSGSTGKPKGVVLSHRNMMTGAKSVAEYLGNTADDRLLAVLPFSFDYGFSQLSTAFLVGASVTLMDYLFARDVITMVANESISGLAGVPPLWVQLAEHQWPEPAQKSLRYVTNSGGAMPRSTLQRLRASLPNTRPFLMYGLTEAFRSTYLPPEEIDRRPDSMGKAIPQAEILVVRPDGSICEADEPGELVHRGSLVAMGYWNDPQKTAERFKPLPGQDPGLVLTEMTVWSGDTVRRDADGFLYFIGRRDEMIKTSGYRVSPTEVEEVLYATGRVRDAVAVGVAHPTLGQAVVIVAAASEGHEPDSELLLKECRQRLPTFMVPLHVEWRDSLPRNPNGKFDRPKLAGELSGLFGASK